jgi:hypothetical protein
MAPLQDEEEKKPKSISCSDFYYINPCAFFRLGADFRFYVFKSSVAAFAISMIMRYCNGPGSAIFTGVT